MSLNKSFKGKAIYNPSGKAGEYSYWACNFYVGCSHICEYCYCKKGVLAHAMGQDKPRLKKCFKSKADAISVYLFEVWKNIDELRKHGLFFSFTTDPMLADTKELTIKAARYAVINKIPVKILTKCTDWVNGFIDMFNEDDPMFYSCKNMFAIGFTLTGHDELEPNASTNESRIKAMECLSNEGFPVFASIEPIIDFPTSLEMIKQTSEFCYLHKIGLQSGKKYDLIIIRDFIEDVLEYTTPDNMIYFKDTLLQQAQINRADLPENCVKRDYNLFTV